MPDRATIAAFIGFVLIGGINFVAVRFSNRELSPYFGAGVRFSIAAVLLVVVVSIRRLPLPRGRALLGALMYGLLAFTVAYALAYTALTTLPAGIGSVVFASTRLFTVFLAPLHGIERFRLRGLLGSIVTLIGILILANPGATNRIPVLPLLAMLGSAAAAAEAGVILKKFPAGNAISTNAIAMGTGGIMLLLISLAASEKWLVPVRASTWVAVSYLAVIGSVGLFGLFLFVLRRWSASSTSYTAALIPLVSVAAGNLIASEPITLSVVIGGAIVIIGVYVGALARQGSELKVTESAPTAG